MVHSNWIYVYFKNCTGSLEVFASDYQPNVEEISDQIRGRCASMSYKAALNGFSSKSARGRVLWSTNAATETASRAEFRRKSQANGALCTVCIAIGMGYEAVCGYQRYEREVHE